jgi:hypothetical protein
MSARKATLGMSAREATSAQKETLELVVTGVVGTTSIRNVTQKVTRATLEPWDRRAIEAMSARRAIEAMSARKAIKEMLVK